MFTIRSPQVHALRLNAEEIFLENMADHLRRHFAEAVTKDDRAALLERVRAGVERGRTHGLQSERDLCRFLGVLTASDLDPRTTPEPPWMRTMLSDRAVSSPSARMDRVAHEALRRLQVEAKAADDREAYYYGT